MKLSRLLFSPKLVISQMLNTEMSPVSYSGLLSRSPTPSYICYYFRNQVLRNDNHIRNANVELQQRAVEYNQLTSIATADVLV